MNATLLDAQNAHRQGNHQAAMSIYQQILQKNPHQAQAWYNLAMTYIALGDNQQAMTPLQKAIANKPNYTLAYNALGHLHFQAGNLLAAEQLFQKALQHDPDYKEALNNLGIVFLHTDRNQQAVEIFLQLLQTFPQHPKIHNNLGNAYSHLGQYQQAISHYKQALHADPKYSDAIINLSNALKESCSIAEAKKTLQQVLIPKSPSGADIREALLLPPIYESTEQIEELRQQQIDRVKMLLEKEIKIIDPLREIGVTNFYATYQGKDDKALNQLVAQLFHKFLPKEYPMPNKNNESDKIKIGFISRFFSNHSVCRSFYGLMSQLPKNKFHITIIQAGGDKNSSFKQMSQIADTHISLPFNMSAARQMIANLKLDVLTYTDIGMDPFTYYLAFTRLAPVQCAMAGHPVTTGITTIDHFISSQLNEMKTAEDHYSEKVTLLSTPLSYQFYPNMPAQPFSKYELNLPTNGLLYVCPMTLIKIHPDFDMSLRTILKNDSNAQLLFFADKKNPSLKEFLIQRFKKTIAPSLIKRIHFHPHVPVDQFMHILRAADVLLDPFHFGAGNTSYMAIASQTPMITWPSPFLRGRTVHGHYQLLGITDCTVQHRDDYATKAVAVATNPIFRNQLQEKIAASKDALFTNQQLITELTQFYQNICCRN